MIDPIFQSENYHLARKLMDATVLRQEAIAANIANVETPGYRRVDIAPDFLRQLKASLAAGELARRGPDLAPRLAEDTAARNVKPDGNTVEIERELLALNQNAIEHEFLSEILTRNVKQLKHAITGRQP